MYKLIEVTVCKFTLISIIVYLQVNLLPRSYIIVLFNKGYLIKNNSIITLWGMKNVKSD